MRRNSLVLATTLAALVVGCSADERNTSFDGHYANASSSVGYLVENIGFDVYHDSSRLLVTGNGDTCTLLLNYISAGDNSPKLVDNGCDGTLDSVWMPGGPAVNNPGMPDSERLLADAIDYAPGMVCDSYQVQNGVAVCQEPDRLD